MNDIHAVILRGVFDGFDLAGNELRPVDETIANPISLNPGDSVLLRIISAKTDAYGGRHGTRISFPFKNQAGQWQAFMCNSGDSGELDIRVTAKDTTASDMTVIWSMSDRQFNASTREI